MSVRRGALSGGIVLLSVWLILVRTANPAQNPPVSPGETAGAAQGFKIAGTVVNAITGAPLARVRVSLADTRARMQRIEMITGEGGHFEFADLAVGKYALQGQKRGYLASGYEQHEQYSTAIVTGPEFATDQLVFRLMPMAMISGHILDEAGEPVRNAQVQLFTEDHRGGMDRIAVMSGAMGDDRGYFEFDFLPPGTYFVSVSAQPWYAVYPQGREGDSAQKVTPVLNVAYPTTYYGGATDSQAATAIQLKGGEQQQADIHLAPVPALRVVFRVPVEPPKTAEGEQAQPQNYFRMVVLQKHVFDSLQFTRVGQTQMIEPGVFEISGVPAGKYDVTIRGQDPKDAEQLGEMELTREGQDLGATEGEPLATLKVTLKMPNDEPLPKQYAMALRAAQQKIVAFQPGTASGELRFEALRPGNYGLVILGPGKRYSVVRTTSASGVVVAGPQVTIVPGASMELTAELAGGETRIEGVVQKNGKPLAGVMVALVPNDPEAHVDLFRRDQSDFDGTFLLQGVIPGTYTVVAVEDAWGFEWLKAGVLARYIQHGQEVIIGGKMRGTLHLPEPVEVQSK